MVFPVGSLCHCVSSWLYNNAPKWYCGTIICMDGTGDCCGQRFSLL
jgi:hypothetical protein